MRLLLSGSTEDYDAREEEEEEESLNFCQYRKDSDEVTPSSNCALF